MHCNALQCTAMHCNALQCTATHRNTARPARPHIRHVEWGGMYKRACLCALFVCVSRKGGVVVHCSASQLVAVRCSISQCVAVYGSVLQCVAV